LRAFLLDLFKQDNQIAHNHADQSHDSEQRTKASKTFWNREKAAHPGPSRKYRKAS
jgi:hypothetical protein